MTTGVLSWADMRMAILLNTGFFETNAYTIETQMPITAGGWDNAGASFGNLQYNYGAADRASELWIYVLTNHADVVQAAFGADTAAYTEFRDAHASGSTTASRKAWAESITDYSDGEGRKLLLRWRNLFAALLVQPEVLVKYQQMMDAYYIPDALDLFKQFSCKSRAALATIFDVNVNKGRYYPCNLIQVDFEAIDANPALTEEEKEAQKIYQLNWRANEEENALNDTSSEAFLPRRQCQANQGGTYWGGLYDPEVQFDINQEPAIPEKNAAGGFNVKLGEIDVSNIYLGSSPIDKIYLGAELLAGGSGEIQPYYSSKTPQTQFRTNAGGWAGIGNVSSITLDVDQPMWIDVQNFVACKTHFTIDGSTPTAASDVYSGALKFTQSCTLKTVTISTGGIAEAVKTLTVNVNAPVTEGWRYLRITPDSMNGHWQGAEVEVWKTGANVALGSTGALVPAADNANNFGTYAGLVNGDKTTATVYYTWGFPLRIDMDLGSLQPLIGMDIWLGNSTTNKTTPASVQVSKNGTDWISGKVVYVNNPTTLQQTYTISN